MGVGVNKKEVWYSWGRLHLTSVAMASILPCISSCASKPACKVGGGEREGVWFVAKGDVRDMPNHHALPTAKEVSFQDGGEAWHVLRVV